MSDVAGGGSAFSLRSAGTMIRDARKAQGVHIEALAASIKVSQHKLELLEADRVGELPDATFVRALAQTVCRSLKIDPQPVLAQLPQAGGHRLDQISEGINAPFRDRPGRRGEPGDYWAVLARPAVWGPALLVLAAFALYVAPAGWLAELKRLPRLAQGSLTAAPAPLPLPGSTETPRPAAPLAEAPPVVETVHSAPPPSALPADAGATLQLRANAESWVEVVDARSRTLLSRMLQPGETVTLDGAMPMRLKVGNAAGTEAVFRGRVLDLTSGTRDNVARLELK